MFISDISTVTAAAAQRMAFMLSPQSGSEVDAGIVGGRAGPPTEFRIPPPREDFPSRRECGPLRPRGGGRHRRRIATVALAPSPTGRHAARWSAASLLVTLVGTVAAVV